MTGDIGSPTRREFTVLGEAFTLKSLGGVMLRGRDTELEVFDVLG